MLGRSLLCGPLRWREKVILIDSSYLNGRSEARGSGIADDANCCPANLPDRWEKYLIMPKHHHMSWRILNFVIIASFFLFQGCAGAGLCQVSDGRTVDIEF